MTPNNIKAYFLRAGYQGYFGEIQNTLEAKQKYVGGLIQVISLDDVDIICNDEGKLMGLPVNRAIVDDDENVLDVIVGDIICLRHDDEGEFVDIHETDLQIIRKYLRPCVILGERAGATIVRLIPEEVLEIWRDEK